MPAFVYDDFYLIIHPRNSDGQYRAQVLGSAGGDAEGVFTVEEITPSPAPPPDGSAVPVPTRAAEFKVGADTLWVINAQPPTLAQAKDLGSRFFNAVFKKKVYAAFKTSLYKARNNNARLRLRLDLTSVPELAVRPWELLFDESINHFYSTAVESPLVRYLQLGEESGSLSIDGPLRVLVMTAGIPGLPFLDIEEEWRRLTEALAEPVKAGNVEVERVNGSSVAALSDHLIKRANDRPFNVFHFIGHGAFNPATRESLLLLSDESGKNVRPINAERLSGILANHRQSLRLVILNSCEGARTDANDPYGSTAQNLIQQAGVPAVIAMQYRITDRTAIKYTRHFYTALAAGHPIETALSHGRALIFADGEPVEWATPVLFLRSKDGQLFVRRGQLAPLPPSKVTPELEQHYQDVIRALLDDRLVPFLGLDVNLYGRKLQERWEPGGAYPPSSRELADHLARIHDYPAGQPCDLLSVCQHVSVMKEGVGQLYDEISDILNHEYEITPLHRFLAELPFILREKGYQEIQANKVRPRFVVVTTTYDNLLERAFQELNRPFHLISYVTNAEQSGSFYHSKYVNSEASPFKAIPNPDDFRLEDTNPIILKLPGAVELLEQRFAIIEDHFCDYLKFKNFNGLLPPELTFRLKSHQLFLGIRLVDWHLRALLYRIWENRKPNRKSWAVHPEQQPIDEHFWKAADVDAITFDLESYIAGLRDRIERLPKK